MGELVSRRPADPGGRQRDRPSNPALHRESRDAGRGEPAPEDGSQRRSITPEGTSITTGSHAISPDGMRVAAVERGQIVLYPVDGGAAPVPVPGLSPGDVPSRWSPDGRSLYVYRQNELPARVFRVDVASGGKELWKTLGSVRPAGVTGLGHVILTPDGTSYIYNYLRTLSDLYLVDGLK